MAPKRSYSKFRITKETNKNNFEHSSTSENSVNGARSGTKKKYKQFLKGPICLNWLNIAKENNSNTLTVGLCLWHLSSLNKCMTFQATKKAIGKWFNVSPQQVGRAVSDLEKLGLINVTRKKGSKSTYTIIENLDINKLSIKTREPKS